MLVNDPFDKFPGIPHQSMKEETFRGKVIPARSMIIPNIWYAESSFYMYGLFQAVTHFDFIRYMMRDDRFFSDPHKFKPDRFLTKAEGVSTSSLQHFRPDDPSSVVFGFGRRYIVLAVSYAKL